jgi:hypothetical protein
VTPLVAKADGAKPADRERASAASERVGGSGPPPPRSGFGEVSPEPASTIARAEVDGAKPPGKN